MPWLRNIGVTRGLGLDCIQDTLSSRARPSASREQRYLAYKGLDYGWLRSGGWKCQRNDYLLGSVHIWRQQPRGEGVSKCWRLLKRGRGSKPRCPFLAVLPFISSPSFPFLPSLKQLLLSPSFPRHPFFSLLSFPRIRALSIMVSEIMDLPFYRRRGLLRSITLIFGKWLFSIIYCGKTIQSIFIKFQDFFIM